MLKHETCYFIERFISLSLSRYTKGARCSNGTGLPRAQEILQGAIWTGISGISFINSDNDEFGE